jgi:hypothetical protein
MTPPECDLRGLPFMPLDVVRLVDSDLMALTTGDEFKVAVILWCKAWLQVPAASLPDDDRVLAHLTGAGPRWKKIKEMALHGFVLCSDGRWYHPVIAEKAREAWKHRQKQREKANKRWGNADVPGGGTATGDAAAYAPVMQGRGRGNKEVSNDTSTREVFPKPDFATPEVWRDFLANRKRKRLSNTATAHKALLDDIARLASDEWPPGRLLEYATGKGWGAIYDPRDQEHRNGQPAAQPIASLRGTRPDPALDLLRMGQARIAAERGDAGADRGAWPALPSQRGG